MLGPVRGNDYSYREKVERYSVSCEAFNNPIHSRKLIPSPDLKRSPNNKNLLAQIQNFLNTYLQGANTYCNLNSSNPNSSQNPSH